MAVQSRTLEFYRQLGIADEVAAAGFRLDRIRVRNRSRELAVALLGEIGGGISPFPFVLSLPQDDHERLLTERLHAAGHAVEWDTELASFAQRDDGVSATPRKPGGEEAVALRGSRAEVEEVMSANAAIRTSVAPMLSVRQGARAVEFYKAAFESA
jgi:2-polyprenyl-6-methoxyphenol hydroxylase-like FAD-dependent oxidoreductase